MKVVMDKQQCQALACLIDIFDNMFFDDEEVQCFRFIKEIKDNGIDINSIDKDIREQMKGQLIEAFQWLDELNVNIEYKDDFFAFF